MPLTFTHATLVAYLQRTGWTLSEATGLWEHPRTSEVVYAASDRQLPLGYTRASILGVLGRLKARDPNGPDLPEEELTRVSSDPQSSVDSSV